MQGSSEASTSKLQLDDGSKSSGSSGSSRKRARNGKAAAAAVVKEEDLPARSPQPSYTPSASNVNRYMRGDNLNTNTRNKKLATHLSTLANQQRSSAVAAYEHDSLLLPQNVSARLEAETELERTWKVSQDEIADGVGSAAASKTFTLSLNEFGPYELDYTRDGRHLAIAGRKGHVATFDWHTGKLGTEMHLKETVRDISWLHNTSFFAVAQKKYVYIYDSNGLEIHQLRNHIEVNRMEFLRYHFLLATVGNAGFLKYQDTSTGSIVSEHRTKRGACDTMAQNPHNGVISLGHANGTVTMWTPNISTAQVTLLAHKGPVAAVAHDPSSMGTYFATAGLDGSMKVWDARKWATVNEWQLKRPGHSLSYSQKGLLAVGWGNHATIYADSTKTGARAPGPYMTKLFPSTSIHSLSFCPFEDVLGVGHASGLSSLIIPGAGEANYDSLEADPYESKKSRREREVVSLLDKIQPDQIALDPEFIGRLADSKNIVKDPLAGLGADMRRLAGPNAEQAKKRSFAELSRTERLKAKGEDDEPDSNDEESEQVLPDGEQPKVRKPRGKSKVLKRILRRKKNVIDAKSMRVRELIDERKKAAQMQRKEKQAIQKEDDGALGRFA